MTVLRAPLTTTIFEFADRILLGKLLQFPEAGGLSRNSRKLQDELRIQAEKLSDELSLIELHRRQLSAEVRAETISVAIEPPRAERAWRHPIEIPLHAFVWTTDDDVWQASLPLLDFCTIAQDKEQLFERIRSQARFVVARLTKRSLQQLLMLPRPLNVSCRRQELSLDVKTPKELHRGAEDTRPKGILNDIGDNLGGRKLTPAYGRGDLVQQIAELVGSAKPSAVLLVGDSGVGKTAIVRELVRSRDRYGLPFNEYWQTGGSRIVAGMSGFGMWQDRCEQLCREVHEKKVLLHLGNLFELMEVGQHEASQQGIGDYLRPAISSGKLTCTAECTPQELDEIQRRNPRILDAFERVEVAQTSDEMTRTILEELARALLPAVQPLPVETIETNLRLHRRFSTYSARPGRVARFFTYMVEDARAHDDKPLDAGSTIAAFSRQTGLPRPMLDDSVPLDLESAGTWFNERVIGQQPAVKRVLDALASVKTGLTRPGRPIASLLMIGPTGVGKTELAKTLTEFLYQNPDRMTRIDMSEYADPLAAERLAGASWQDEGVLTARVREQPFGVVLLDEFEKAHADVFELLLQILGEGRLTDSVGRVADFSNSVVIMTSNLGAETTDKANFGFRASTDADRRLADHYLKEVRRFLRPEIFNRIDGIVPFSPLSRETVAAIVRKQFDELRVTVADRANNTGIEFSEDVIELVADEGYEPNLGARPIRRMLERLVLAPIAMTLNEEPTKRGGVLQVSLIGNRVRVKLRSAEATDSLQVNEESRQRELSKRAMQVRRRARQFLKNYIVEDLRNDYDRLERQRLRLEKRKKPMGHEQLQLVGALQRQLGEFDGHAAATSRLEERVELTVHGMATHSSAALAEEVTRCEIVNRQFLLQLYGRACGDRDLLLLVLGKDHAFVESLVTSYQRICEQTDMPHELFYLVERRPTLTKLPRHAFPLAPLAAREEYARTRELKDIEYFALPAQKPLEKKWHDLQRGAALAVRHRLAAARLAYEDGYHHRIENGGMQRLQIIPKFEKIKDYEPQPLDTFRRNLSQGIARRIYQFDKRNVTDRLENRDYPIKRSRDLPDLVAQIVEERLMRKAENWFENA